MPPQNPPQPLVVPPAAPQPQPQQAPNAVAPKKRRIPLLIKIVAIVSIVFVAVLIIVFVVIGSATRAPQKVSDQFVNDVQSGDSSAAYALTNQTFQNATTQEELDSVVKRISPLLQGQEKVTNRAIEKSTGIPTTAVFVYEVKTSDGTKYMKVELQKDGDTWKVLNFKSASDPLDTKIE